MPTLMSSQEITAYAHCPSPFCPGHDQEQVKALREEVGLTYMEGGGDLPFVEKSSVHLRFAEEADETCPRCEKHRRELTEQPRVEYQNLSGHDPQGLIGIKYRDDGQARDEGDYDREQNEQRFAQLEKQNAELRAMLEESLGGKGAD